MHILFITPRLPYPLLKGDQLRTFYLIKYLHKKGHKISLLSFIQDEREKDYQEKMLEYCEVVETVLLPKWKSYLNMVLGVFSEIPFQVKFYYSKEMAGKIKKMTINSRYDIIHFVLSRMIPYVDFVNHNTMVLDHIDALSMNMKRRFEREKGIKKLLFYYEWQKVKRYEHSKHDLFHYSIVTSQVDKEYLINENIAVIPNGVDPERFAPVKCKKDIDLIFTGNMGYFPNEDAVLYFSKEIFPLILRQRHDINFYIVGANPSSRIKKLADGKNVFVTGYVDNLKDYLNRTHVSVCPMRSGSGIQNKILEAMASGVPIIATSYAIGSITAEPEKDIIISDEPIRFAEGVLRLLANDKLREKISFNARRFVEQKYRWEASAKELENVYALARKRFN